MEGTTDRHHHPIVREYKPYDDEGRNNPESTIWDIGWDDLTRGYPEYSTDDYEKLDSWWDVIDYFRYILNVIFIVFPMAIIELIFVGYNLFWNIFWNHWWANGNLWLLTNTVFLWWQCFIALLIALEYPFFMRVFRLFRFFTLLFALYYNFFFLCIIGEWFRELYFEFDWEYESYEAIDVIVNMFLIYNVILHFPVVLVNGFIISKEMWLEVFQFLADPTGENGLDMAIGFWDLVNLMDDTLWFLNPLTWIEAVGKIFFNWAIEWFIQWITHDAFSKA